jgi:predicted metal-dependent hydrolase
MMAAQLRLGDITVEVIKKDIKNVHLSVHPPTGSVRIAAPRRMNMEAIRLFAISKLPWIKQHQRKLRSQEREPARDYIDRESHYVWGKRYLLRLVEISGPPRVELRPRALALHCRTDLPQEKRAAALEAWYRQQLKAAVSVLLQKWQPLLGVTASRFFVQRMKTKWGSANPARRTIRLNTELAKKPLESLEYVVVHELSHFISARHDHRFIATLDRHLPQWRAIRERLNTSALPHEEWSTRS